ncbi:ankyrin repeat-containing domain protein [Zopfochytrium polystomum]|nr:ankyrin repeat-containing domain protein [Zopfochytrium polystomum]
MTHMCALGGAKTKVWFGFVVVQNRSSPPPPPPSFTKNFASSSAAASWLEALPSSSSCRLRQRFRQPADHGNHHRAPPPTAFPLGTKGHCSASMLHRLDCNNYCWPRPPALSRQRTQLQKEGTTSSLATLASSSAQTPQSLPLNTSTTAATSGRTIAGYFSGPHRTAHPELWLLAPGNDIAMMDELARRCFRAAASGHVEVAKWLHLRGGDPDVGEIKEKHASIGPLVPVDGLHDGRYHHRGVTGSGAGQPIHTPLSSAAAGGHLAVVQYLHARGADVNATHAAAAAPAASERAASPSMAKGRRCTTRTAIGRVDVLEALLRAGADANVAMPPSLYPLCVAAQNGQLGAVDCLLHHGADVDCLNSADDGNDCAPQGGVDEPPGRGHPPCSRRRRPRKVNGQGLTPMCCRGFGPCGGCPLAGGGRCERESQHWRRFDDAAAWSGVHGRLDVVKLLLEHGAEGEARTAEMQRTLLATNEGHLDVLKALLEACANVNAKLSEIPLLYCVASVGAVDAIGLLIAHGAEVNVTDAEGLTLVHHAILRGQLDALERLHEHGAN